MRVVQMSTDQVVAMIAVRDHLVAARTSMLVVCIVVVACVRGRTTLGVITRDLQTMLVHMALMSCVQMAVVQVVHMAGVADFGMGTARTVLVRVIAMRGVLHRRSIPWNRRSVNEANASRCWMPRNTGPMEANVRINVERAASSGGLLSRRCDLRDNRCSANQAAVGNGKASNRGVFGRAQCGLLHEEASFFR